MVYLGRLLREMWVAKLHRDFPEKDFIVSFYEGPSEGLLDYEITFFQTEKCLVALKKIPALGNNEVRTPKGVET